MDIKAIHIAFRESYTKSDVCRKLGFPINGTGMRKVKDLAEKYEISTEHFDPHHKSKANRKYPLTQKPCPICGDPFEVRKGSPREKTTCSVSCANTYFRSGPNNPNWENDSYRSTCFHYHEKKCVVCDEHRIVAVHHYDHNHNNNSPENLIPICPTHHRYVHSQHAHLVMDKIESYRDTFMASR